MTSNKICCNLCSQEYYNGAQILGCPSAGGDLCTNRASLTAWQLAQIAPIGESATGARDIPYIINVFLQKMLFVAGFHVSTGVNTIDVRVRLVDKSNVPVVEASKARVLFVFNTTQTQLPWRNAIESSYDTGKFLSSC